MAFGATPGVKETSTLTALPVSEAAPPNVAVEFAADDCCDCAMADAVETVRLITYRMTSLDRPI